MESTISRRKFLAGSAVAGAGLAASAGLAPMFAKASENEVPDTWDYEYDIVVCGAGGAGLIAALRANDEGCKVLCIDSNYDTGGHACVSGGGTHSGGGTSVQLAFGIEDSPDLYYSDHTNPSNINTRFNDRPIIREVADRMVECFEWMIEKGWRRNENSDPRDDGARDGDSVARTVSTDASAYIKIDTNSMDSGQPGIGVTRPFEITGRAEGVDYMMNRHMDSLVVDDSGRVVGIRASYTPRILPDGTQLVGEYDDENIHDDSEVLTIGASKAVILATGGGTGNLEWRTMFDPRWTVEYDGVAGEPYSFQDASGEIAGLAIGAGLGDTANWTVQSRSPICANKYIGCRYGYKNLTWSPECQIFPFCGGSGLYMADVDGLIYVNMLGNRFHDENMSINGDDDDNYEFFADAMGSVIVPTDDGMTRIGGPIWAIFDADTAKVNGWNCEYPDVDTENGYFFSADTLEELAGKIINKYYEFVDMEPSNLTAAVNSYNDAVEMGEDEEFGRDPETMTMKIENGPFYAAWVTPILHDSLTGLRTNPHRQVLTIDGQPIPGLYAAGECAGGHKAHGLGKVQTAGYIAGMYAATEA